MGKQWPAMLSCAWHVVMEGDCHDNNGKFQYCSCLHFPFSSLLFSMIAICFCPTRNGYCLFDLKGKLAKEDQTYLNGFVWWNNDQH